jgi:hypothetical protein
MINSKRWAYPEEATEQILGKAIPLISSLEILTSHDIFHVLTESLIYQFNHSITMWYV